MVEDAALGCLESARWHIKTAPEIARSVLAIKRDVYRQVVLTRQRREMLLPKVICRALRMNDAVHFLEAAT